MSESDQAAAIRQRMRQDWSARARFYAERAAAKNRGFAEMLVAAVAPGPGEQVLDVATGPGVVALEAARLVGPAGKVLATDLVPEWEAIIAERASEANVDTITFAAMGAEALTVPDASFDVALCQFGLMFVPDPVQALQEMRRSLRPDGRLGVSVWSTADKVTHFLATRVIMEMAPPVPARHRLPSPLDLGEPGLIERYVADAGFRDIAVARHTREHVLTDPEVEWRQRLEEPNSISARTLAAFTPERRQQAHDAVIAALEAYRRDGEIRLPSEAIVVTARH